MDWTETQFHEDFPLSLHAFIEGQFGCGFNGLDTLERGEETARFLGNAFSEFVKDGRGVNFRRKRADLADGTFFIDDLLAKAEPLLSNRRQ